MDDQRNRPPDTEAAAQSELPARKSPPKVYFAACGALCDVFWWARRKDDPDLADG